MASIFGRISFFGNWYTPSKSYEVNNHDLKYLRDIPEFPIWVMEGVNRFRILFEMGKDRTNEETKEFHKLFSSLSKQKNIVFVGDFFENEKSIKTREGRKVSKKIKED